RHWAVQHLVLQMGAFPYDYVGKTEEFGDVIGRWEAATGLDIAATAKTVGRQNANSLELPSAQVSDAAWNALVEIYALDLKSFEYAADRPTVIADDWHERAAGLLDRRRALDTKPERLTTRSWAHLRRQTSRRSRVAALRRWDGARVRP